LDETLRTRFGLAFSDLAVPAGDFARWSITGISVVITENKMNFLTLPDLANTIGIWGAGNAASLLSECRWLESCRIIYWGDLDVSGFEILSRLRTSFPKTQTILMDRITLEQFIHLAVPGKNCSREAPNLTPSERAAFDKVISENLLIEQEKVPNHVSKQALDTLIRGAATDLIVKSELEPSTQSLVEAVTIRGSDTADDLNN
jgi:hypothetical protein